MAQDDVGWSYVPFERMVHESRLVESRITCLHYHRNTSYARLSRSIRTSRLDSRKEILKLLRVSDTPDRNTFLAQQLPLLSLMESDYSITNNPTDQPLAQQKFFDYLNSFFLCTDIATSLAQCYAKTMPLLEPIREATEARYNSAVKELQASQTLRTTASKVNYDVIFNNCIYDKWSEEVDPNPGLAKYYNYALREWRKVGHTLAMSRFCN
jgi:hypothetical protein